MLLEYRSGSERSADMAPSPKISPFMGATPSRTADGYDAAIFGAPHGTPYTGIDNRVHQSAPDAFRKAIAPDAEWLEHWDFDLQRPLLGNGIAVCDLGNLKTASKDAEGNRHKIESCTAKIIEAGAVPIMFGGDDSVPIPFIAGFAHHPAIVILQIDAHIDWRDERYGEPNGFSSTMRRASERDHVWRIVQVGARGMGSARQAEIEDAENWGARIIRARDVHHHGLQLALDSIPDDSECVICLDCDALDASEMPAVAYPSPGGLTFTQVTDLIAGVAAKAHIAGFCMVEFVPKRDPAGIAAFTAARIACNVIGRITKHR